MRRIKVPWSNVRRTSAGNPGRLGGLALGAALVLGTMSSAIAPAAPAMSPALAAVRGTPALRGEEARNEALDRLGEVARTQRSLHQQLRDGESRMLVIRDNGTLDARLCAHQQLERAQNWFSFVETSDRLAWEALATEQLDHFARELELSARGQAEIVRSLEQFSLCESEQVMEDGNRLSVVHANAESAGMRGRVAWVEALVR